jgi:hypothetical protein
MKARLPINNKLKQQVRQEVAKEYERQGQDATRRIFKLFCIALNEKYGFGKNRLLSVLQEVECLSVESQQDEVFWTHVDKVVVDQLGINFEKENYCLMDR